MSGGMIIKKNKSLTITGGYIHTAHCENSKLEGFRLFFVVRMSWKTSNVICHFCEFAQSVAGPAEATSLQTTTI